MLDLEGHGVVDEVVIEQWFHLEQMDKRVWWIRVGDVYMNVRLKKGVTVTIAETDLAPGSPKKKWHGQDSVSAKS